jgi:RNA polymerase sigma-70 factor (ECF subfamily)
VSIDGRSQAEAASLLGVSEKAIETRVYRARQRLREKFEKF